MKIPFSRNIELLSYTKTNGYCCMLSITPDRKLIVATRNLSMLVEDLDSLTTSGNSSERFATHREITKLWDSQTEHLDDSTYDELCDAMEGKTWVCEYLNQADSCVVRYPSGEPQLVFHSIVENSTGVIQGDAYKVFKRYG